MPRRSAKRKPWYAEPDLETYFGVADEIYEAIVAKRDLGRETAEADFMAGSPGLTLADLQKEYVAAAKEWADANGAPWPPYLPWAEERRLQERQRRQET